MNTMAKVTVRELIQTEIERHELAVMDSLAEDMKLWQWGRWGRRTGNNLGYPRCLLPFTSKIGWEKDLHKYIGEISDEDALKIERAVVSLPQAHRTLIIAIYRVQVRQRKLPEIMQTSMRQIDYLHHQALGMLWNELKGKKTLDTVTQ
jgi:DNA-directed RNA polymerase specialized sigma24 family protein